MLKNKKNKKSGFTLVETLVAIAILSISILGSFTAIQSSLQNSEYARDQIVAFYLNQEVMEYIRNIRDQNALANINSISTGGAGVNWLHGLAELSSDPCYFGKVCRIDPPNAPSWDIVYCGTSIGSCPPLNFSPSLNLFSYSSGGDWTASRFKREVQLTSIAAGREISVTVTISWPGHSFSVRQLLLNNR